MILNFDLAAVHMDEWGNKWRVVFVPAGTPIPPRRNSWADTRAYARGIIKDSLLDNEFFPESPARNYDSWCLVPHNEPEYNDWGEVSP